MVIDHSHISQDDGIDWPHLKMYVLLQWLTVESDIPDPYGLSVRVSFQSKIENASNLCYWKFI